MVKPTVLLLSSDLRRRYAEDILTALAMPAGSMIQFRYEAAYVAPALQRAIADGTIVGSTALVAFSADLTIRHSTITGNSASHSTSLPNGASATQWLVPSPGVRALSRCALNVARFSRAPPNV